MHRSPHPFAGILALLALLALEDARFVRGKRVSLHMVGGRRAGAQAAAAGGARGR